MYRIMGNTGFCGCFFVQSGGCVQVKDTDAQEPALNDFVIAMYRICIYGLPLPGCLWARSPEPVWTAYGISQLNT